MFKLRRAERPLGGPQMFWVLLAALTWPLAAAPQTVTPEHVGLSSARLERIDELVERSIEAGEIAGAVTLVARHGRIAHLRAHGVADLDTGMPMQTDTLFRIASMSKPVAAVALLMLAEEGKLRLTDPVVRFLPEYASQQVAVPRAGAEPRSNAPAIPGVPQAASQTRPAGPSAGAAPSGPGGFGGPLPEFDTEPAARQITLLDLLTHTSGVMSGRISNSIGQPLSAARHEEGVAWVAALGDVPLEFQPGTRWAYSALAGFDIISRVVEIVSGVSFDEFVRERIFGPLGGEDAFFWPNDAQRARLATVYQRRGDELIPNPNPDSMSSPRYFSGAGGLMTSAEAYARFAMMLANGGALDGKRLLSPRSVELMGSAFIPDTVPGRQPGESYGLGVRVVTDPVAMRTWMTEGTFGWSGLYGTHFIVDPHNELAAVLLAQTASRTLLSDFENAVLQALVD